MRLAPAYGVLRDWPRGAAVWLAVYGMILAAWAAVFAMVQLSDWVALADAPQGLWEALCAGAANAAFVPLAAMWAIMVAAMMLPGFVPAVRTFLELPGRATRHGRLAPALVAGFLAVWGAVALIGASVQQALAGAALVGPTGASLTPWLTAGLLLLAGGYQFTALKAACLTQCQAPLTWFMGHWRDGAGGAFAMGTRLGVLCVGCCWALMALGFVGGTMNLMFMGLATVFMTLEKLPRIGQHLTAPAGCALIGAGIGMAAHAARWI